MHRRLHEEFAPAAAPEREPRQFDEPDIEPLHGSVRAAILIGAAAGSWALLLIVGKRLLALF
jgi:hypothetical protein